MKMNVLKRFMFVMIMDRVIIRPMEQNNARIEQEEREKLLKMIAEENDSDDEYE